MLVCEAKDPKSKKFEKLLPDCIFSNSIPMDWTVHFHNQPGGKATEIDEESFKGDLSTEFHAANLPLADTLPQPTLCGCWVLAHLARHRLQPLPQFRRRLKLGPGDEWFVRHVYPFPASPIPGEEPIARL